MTDIEVLINNISMILLRAGNAILLIWGVYYFFRNLFKESGRDPARIAIAVLAITGAAAAWKLVPTFLEIGGNTGTQLTGGSGGAYSMPALPSVAANTGHTGEGSGVPINSIMVGSAAAVNR